MRDPLLRLRRPRAADRPEHADRRAARPRRTARSTCAPTRSRSRTSACGRRWPCSSTATGSSTACSRARRARERLAVRAGVQVHGHVGRRSASRTSRRPSSCSSEAGADGFEVELDTWDGFEIPDLAQLIQNNAKEVGIDDQAEHHRRRHVLRRRGLRQVAVAGLHHGHHRLRPPRHRQRVPRRAAAVRRHVERRALPQQGVRRARQGLHRAVRHRPAEAARRRRSRSCSWTRRR